MRFHEIHKLLSYLLAATAVATLASSGAVPVTALGLLVACGALSWFVEPGTRLGHLLDRAALVFNVVALAFFFLSLYQVIKTFPEPDLTPVTNLVLFLLGYKLLQRRNNRDYLQLYVLSFMTMLAAAWLGQSVVFLAGFALFVVLATWCLILFHLRREIEDNYLVKHTGEAGTEKITATRVLNSRRVVGGSFFVVTGGVALAVFLGACAVFASVPRVGLGFLLGGVRRRVNIVGFSDQVQLGHHGLLSTDNKTVVLRADVASIAAIEDDDRRDRAIRGLYWRGTVYDHYQDGGWHQSKGDLLRTRLDRGTSPEGGDRFFVGGPEDLPPAPGALANRRRAALAAATKQVITVVGLTHPVAFALDAPLAFEAPPPGQGSFVITTFDRRWSGEVALGRRLVLGRNLRRPPLQDFKGAEYVAYSRTSLERPRITGTVAMDAVDRRLLAPYLEVPASIAPRLEALARGLTRDKPSTATKVDAIVAWLRSTHDYTIDLKRNTKIADPVEDFLFHQTAGHCEYFASGAALLLRAAGIPSRYVNGFLGGEWNDLGDYITIRDNRAHSWVEAYLGTLGWVRVDATPAAVAPSHMSRLRQLFDSIELLWSRWVVDYDASRQLDVAKSVRRSMGMEGALDSLRTWTRSARPLLLGLLALAAAVIVVVKLRRRRRGGQRPRATSARADRGGGPVYRLYHQTLERLARHGWTRGHAETPREFARRYTAAGGPGAAEVDELTQAYAAARFGDRAIPPEQLRRLSTDVSAALAHRDFPPPPPAQPV